MSSVTHQPWPVVRPDTGLLIGRVRFVCRERSTSSPVNDDDKQTALLTPLIRSNITTTVVRHVFFERRVPIGGRVFVFTCNPIEKLR